MRNLIQDLATSLGAIVSRTLDELPLEEAISRAHALSDRREPISLMRSGNSVTVWVGDNLVAECALRDLFEAPGVPR
jgi:hypothetical protein